MSRGHVAGTLQTGVQPLQAFPSGQSLTGYAEHVYEQPEGEPPVETNAIRYWRDWAGLRNGQLELRLNNQRAPRVHGLGWGLDPDAGVWRPLRVDATGALVVTGGGPTPPEPGPPTEQLIGWWRADDLAQAEGSNVDSWTDRSGNTGALTVPAGAIAPTFTASFAGLGGQPAVQFLSGIRQLWRQFPPNYPVGSGGFSLYVVHEPIFSGSINTMFGWGQNFSARMRMCFSLFNSSPWFIAADAFGEGTAAYAASSAPQITSIYSANGASMNDAEVWIDGAPGTVLAPGSANTWDIANPCPEVRMGGLSQETAVAYSGTIAEVIVYNKHQGAGERAATLAYLSARYGIPV